jgi:hypothetical protein
MASSQFAFNFSGLDLQSNPSAGQVAATASNDETSAQAVASPGYTSDSSGSAQGFLRPAEEVNPTNMQYAAATSQQVAMDAIEVAPGLTLLKASRGLRNSWPVQR